VKLISETYKELQADGVWTDKDELGYLEDMYDLLLDRRDYENILEIGCRGGGSISLWEECFPESNIFGVDIYDFPQPKRATKIIGDAYCDEFVGQFDDSFFDVIIDDGAHTYSSFKDVVHKYHSKLKKGGLLVIEDLIRPYNGMGVTEAQQQELLTVIVANYNNVLVWDMTEKPKTQRLRNKWRKGLFVISAYK